MRRRFGELFYVFATTIFVLALFVSDGEEPSQAAGAMFTQDVAQASQSSVMYSEMPACSLFSTWRTLLATVKSFYKPKAQRSLT
jgi:hypothetical protein